jgi:hypothetical protein
MAKFRPEIQYITTESLEDYNNNGRRNPYKILQYNSYKELKKDLPGILKIAVRNHATVTRYRRGCYGEWCEQWQLNLNNKPIILEQNWLTNDIL